MNNLFRLAVLLAICSLPVQAKEIAGIDMPDSLAVNGTTLSLNGAGIRSKFFMDIYAGGLYLEAASKNADDIIAADQTMAMRLHMFSSLISSEAMEEATLEGFEKASSGKTKPMAIQIDSFVEVFRETISENDVFDIVYVSGKGIDVYTDGTFISSIENKRYLLSGLVTSLRIRS